MGVDSESLNLEDNLDDAVNEREDKVDDSDFRGRDPLPLLTC